MKITDLVNRLEEIEKVSDSEAKELCANLIDDLIEYDLKMAQMIKNASSPVMKELEQEGDEFIKFLMEEGIKSGSIGEA